MEPVKANRRTVAWVVLAVAAGAVLAIVAYRHLSVAPLGQLARPGLPMLDLHVKLVDGGGNEVEAGDSKIAGGDGAPADERCPELVGGDSSEVSTPADNAKRPADCPQAATWHVRRHPIGFTLYFVDGQAVLEAFDKHPRWRELFDGKFVQGLFYEPLHSASVRAEDLFFSKGGAHPNSLPKGEGDHAVAAYSGLEGQFLRRLVTEAIAAHAQLHYDIAHGKKGFVLSFVRAESPFAGKALPAISGMLARSGYRLAKLPEPVLEMRIGLQRLFLTQYADRVYLANGLEALLNVIDSATPPSGGLPDAPLALTLRAEAFVDKMLPVVVGKPNWEITAAFTLADGDTGQLRFPSGRFVQALHPTLFKGVLASIPHDAFAAVAASFRLSPEMTAEDWRKLATGGPAVASAEPKESGVAVLWDLDAKGERLESVGVAVASQDRPDATEAFRQYLTDADLSTACAGGTVFLAASSEKLLTRMKESCAGQSLSMLDWERGGLKATYDTSQFVLFMSPGEGLRELFLAGGAGGDDLGDFEPQWKQQYEQAKAAMRRDGEKLFGALPVFVYAGSVKPGADTVILPGHAVAQGVSP